MLKNQLFIKNSYFLLIVVLLLILTLSESQNENKMLFLDFFWNTAAYCCQFVCFKDSKNPQIKVMEKIFFIKNSYFLKKSKNCQKLQKIDGIWSFVRQLLFSIEWWVFMRFERLYPQNLSLFSNFLIQNSFLKFCHFWFLLKSYCPSLFFTEVATVGGGGSRGKSSYSRAKIKNSVFYSGQFTRKNKKSCLSRENKICLKKMCLWTHLIDQ